MLLYNFQNAQRVYLGNLDVSKILLGSSEIFSSIQIEADPYSDYVVLLNHFNTDFSDSSTNNFSLTAYGNTQIDANIKKFGTGSILLSGNNSYVNAPADSAFLFGNADFTVECWFYTASSSQSQCIFSNLPESSVGFSLVISPSFPSGGVYAIVISNIGSLTTAISPLFNEWNHVALVRENNALYIFQNGVRYNAIPNFTNTISTNSCIIGARFSSSTLTNYFSGYIDDFRITKGIARYTTNFVPPSAQLPAPSDPYGENVSLLLHMDGVDGSTDFIDSSTNNFTLTSFGDAQIDTNIKKFGSGAAYFDGNGDYLLLQAESDSCAFETNDFTIEWWEYIVGWSGQYFPILHYSSLGDTSNFSAKIGIRYENSGGFLRVSSNGAFADFTSLTTPLNTWRHCTLVRQGNSLRLYRDGIQHPVTPTINWNITQSTADSIIGGAFFGGGAGVFYSANGYIDELRITKGVARYTSNFIPQTAPFANPPSYLTFSTRAAK